jgi:AhpD family alkylhydroperoxidase
MNATPPWRLERFLLENSARHHRTSLFSHVSANQKTYHNARELRNGHQIGIQNTSENLSCPNMNRFAIYTHQSKLRGTHSAQRGDKSMMLDWNEYLKELGARIGELAKLSPDTVRGYQTLSAANSKTGKLDEKTRQLISLAVAVTTRCDGCIDVHSEAALKAGATKEEISEALGVAVAMNAGAALVYSSRVLDAVAAHTAKAQGA